MYRRVLCRVKNVVLRPPISALSHSYVLFCGLTPLKRPTCDLRHNPCQKAWSKTNCPPSSTVASSPRETLLRVYLQRDAAVQWKKPTKVPCRRASFSGDHHALDVTLTVALWARSDVGWEVKADDLGSPHVNHNVSSEVFSCSPKCSSVFFPGGAEG